MKAVLFAAGKSTRTYPLTVDKPKPLLKAANQTIIEHNLGELQGIADEAIIIIGYNGDMIRQKLGNSFGKIKIRYIEQKEQNGNGSALLLAEDLIEGRFIAMNSDDFFSRKDIEKCIKHRYCILVKEVDDLTRFGEVIVNGNLAADFREKPIVKKSGLASTGMLFLDSEIFNYVLKRSERGEYEVVDYIKYLIRDKKEVFAERADDYWIPVSYPWNLLDANEFFLSKIKAKNLGIIEKGSIIKGNVVIGKDTLIRSGAYIEGPVVIGDNCKIGPNCYIRSSTTIGNNSKIGNAVEVKNSVIGDNTSIGHLSYIGDSVIGDNVNFGAGTITANLRHDDLNIKSPIKDSMVDSGRRKLGTIIGDNVHTGIHTTIYPGRKIWPGRTTLPGQIVEKDLM